MTDRKEGMPHDSLAAAFHPVVWTWFSEAFAQPTRAQQEAWPAIARRENTLLLAPTGSGKTLASFLVALDRIMFPQLGQSTTRTESNGDKSAGVRALYISPLKALGVDVQRNLRAPLAGIRAVAQRMGETFVEPRIAVRSGDTPSQERQQINRNPPDILITTPESLFLLLTSQARRILPTIETVIIDEIHSMVGTKRGAHLFTSLERLERLRERTAAPALQRIGLSATQRPLDEVARLLGGASFPGGTGLLAAASEGTGDAKPATPRSETKKVAVNAPDPTFTASLSVDKRLARPQPRPVTIVEAGRSRQLELQIEVPVDDMTNLAGTVAAPEVGPDGEPVATAVGIPSIWPAIHPRLIELIRAHRSTMIFVNSRRLAERLATSLNETAGEELSLAHHGSIAKVTRQQIEDRLKRGELPAIVATSSLELGIDMGAVDLVVQIEAPPSIASGIQRIGRASHQVGGTSTGIVFPKFRGDLLACSAAAKRMLAGEVEETFYPRNPLDVLAQQIVAIVAEGPIDVDELFRLVQCAAPFMELPRTSYESVLDMLAGRYPSDEFSELRPRLNWDRITHTLSPRKSTQRLAVVNAGTIPDRGLYGVFLAGNEGKSSRVGELDEEMVFETRPGEVFLLGASSWRVTEITNDKVYVVPAPGEPGRMPFWRGDGPGRPYEFGVAIGQLTRELLRMKPDKATMVLTNEHRLDERAARNLLEYLNDQVVATGEAPSDKTIVVESFIDEIGDWRIAVLTPFGARVHAPWATAISARLREQTGDDVEMVWTDDGMLFRLPEANPLAAAELLFPEANEIESLVVDELGTTALFAGRFRENAGRALLLPRRYPGRRTPLWLQRRKSASLLAVAAQYPSFPIILETYRECLRDVFDLKSLKSVLQSVRAQSIRVHQVQTETASPFASTLLYSYTASFLYNGDTPLAERRAQTLALDHTQLSELLGAAEMRELLTAEAVDQLSLELQRLDPRFAARDEDHVHDLLRHLGDLSRDELAARTQSQAVDALDGWLTQLVSTRRVIEIRVGGDQRYAAVEDAARYRDALGIVPPAGLPSVFLEPPAAPLKDLLARYARTHVPFMTDQVAERFGLGHDVVHATLDELSSQGKILAGEFLPGGRGREWCDGDVLRSLKQRSLAQWRKQIEPVEQQTLARFLPQWFGITNPRRGLDGLLDVVEQLQAMPLPASVLENDILPQRLVDYQPSDLDELCAAGEIIWRGCESLGTDDGKIALYLTDHFPRLATEPELSDDETLQAIIKLLAARGALFFDQVADQLGGFRNDLLASLWQLVWSGWVTNDTFAPLRSRRKPPRHARTSTRSSPRSRRSRVGASRFRSRRAQQTDGAEGRWSLLSNVPLLSAADGESELGDARATVSATERQLALANQLIQRYGVLTREMVMSEGLRGGFSGIYPVLKSMEEAGKVRRGYFIAGLGAAQFAAPGAEDRLRQQQTAGVETSSDVFGRQDRDEAPKILVMSACDPANPYGAALAWPPSTTDHNARPQRSVGARVVIDDGRLLAYIGRTGESLLTFLADDEIEARRQAMRLAEFLATQAERQPVLLSKVDGQPASQTELRDAFQKAGFTLTSRGLHCT